MNSLLSGLMSMAFRLASSPIFYGMETLTDFRPNPRVMLASTSRARGFTFSSKRTIGQIKKSAAIIKRAATKERNRMRHRSAVRKHS